MKETRKKSVKVRFFEEELLQAKANCPRSEFARWLRELSLNQVSDNVQIEQKKSDVDIEFLRQVSGIGNNLNQITKKVNSKYDTLNSIELLHQLSVIEKQMNELLKKNAG